MTKDFSITTKVNGATVQQLDRLANTKGITVSELASQMIEDQVSYQQTEKEPEQPVTEPQPKLVVAITLIDGGHTFKTLPELDLPTRLRLVAAIDGVIDAMPKGSVSDQAMMETEG